MIHTVDNEIYICNWRGDVEKARCRHCSFLKAMDPVVNKESGIEYDRSRFLGRCTKCRRYVPRVAFACEEFLPKESFSLVKKSYQLQIF